MQSTGVSIDSQGPVKEVSSVSLTRLTKSLAYAVLGPALPIEIIYLIVNWADSSDSTIWIFGGLFLFTIVGLWNGWRLKNVSVQGDNFLISTSDPSAGTTITVPFGEVKDIRQTLVQRHLGDTITIELDNRTKFGRKIVFMPPLRHEALTALERYDDLWEHPLVDELRRAISSY